MFQFSRNILLAVALLTFCATGYAAELRDGHPQQYVVKKGDTLWDISGKFLRNPWEWPQIWNANPGIKDPHWIYPGDVLALTYVNGKPRLMRKKRGKGSPIGTVNARKLRPFISRPALLSQEDVDLAGYILSFKDSNLIAGENTLAYARNIDATLGTTYDVVRVKGTLEDFDTGEALGYGARHVGRVTVVREGDPATVKINEVRLEVRQGDLLVPVRKTTVFRARPQVPDNEISGHVIATERGQIEVGTYDSVVIDRGKREGLVAGDVLVAKTNTREVEDKWTNYREPLTAAEMGEPNSRPVLEKNMVTLPEEHAAHLLLYRVFDRVSVAIVMKAKQEVLVGAPVYSP